VTILVIGASGGGTFLLGRFGLEEENLMDLVKVGTESRLRRSIFSSKKFSEKKILKKKIKKNSFEEKTFEIFF